MKGAVQATVVGLRITRHPSAGDEVQPPAVVGSIVPAATHFAEVVGGREPNPRQHRVRTLGNAVGNRAQHRIKPALLSSGDHRLWELAGIH